MGGSVRAESELGHGSRFFVELKLPRVNAPQPARSPVRSEARLPSELHVLVAEDNPINQKVVCSMLRRQGWSVTLAVNGAEAVRYFTESRFDLILMDVQMPEMDGLEATLRIRTEELRRGLVRAPILAITAHASNAHREQCLASGMDGMVTKPVNLPALLLEIAAALDSATVPRDSVPTVSES